MYVLKVINMDMGNQQVRRQVTREVRALDGARHPHVVSYHQSFFAEGAVTILMEFMDGGTLWDLLQKVSLKGAGLVDLVVVGGVLGSSWAVLAEETRQRCMAQEL